MIELLAIVVGGSIFAGYLSWLDLKKHSREESDEEPKGWGQK